MQAAVARSHHAEPGALEGSPVVSTGWLEFASHLARKQLVTGDFLSGNDERMPSSGRKLRDLWQLTDLAASDFAAETAAFYKLPQVDLPALLAAKPQTALFANRFLRESTIFPYRVTDEGPITLAVADPTDTTTLQAAKLVLRGPLALVIASFEDISTVLSARIGEDAPTPPAGNEPQSSQTNDDVQNLRDLASGAPVVRAVNDLLEQAMELRATDIHIEPFRSRLIIRMRIDGLLRTIATPPDVLPQALISRIKILTGLNIAERRLPQDGAAHLRIARSDVDIRVASMPSQHGESVVIRLLPKDRGFLEIGKLGLLSADQAKLQDLLSLPHGIIVITGPTGSGKTTTLATMLTALNDATRKILTIEDPVEYEIAGVNQSQVKPEIGLTFATALRAFVRQDPDVIMVGEVRDAETANIAVHAALTGHLVLTTLHTETAAGAAPRLLDLGVESFLLQSTLRAVIAQRLVRILCERCKIERHLDQARLRADPRYGLLGFSAGDCVHEPRGCERCSGTGYRGRTGVFEVMEVNEELRNLLGSKIDSKTITRSAAQLGMTTMFEHGIAKCRAGVTSAAEVLRVATAR
jgi:general secretion pathway protein E